MRYFITLLCLAYVLILPAQKKIALLEPRVGTGSTAVNGLEKAMVRGELRKAIVNINGFDAVTRADIDQVMEELDFQRTGMVSQNQIKQIGELEAADYICVSTVTKSDSEFYVEAYLIHLETGTISNPASQYGELINGKLANMMPACQALAKELLGGNALEKNMPVRHASLTNKNNLNHQSNYIETARGIDMKMIWVENGAFQMGCTPEQSPCEDNENNMQQVTMSGFYIAMLEVSQSQWEKVMGTSVCQQRDKANGTFDPAQSYLEKMIRGMVNKNNNNFALKGVGANYPMYYVNWEEANEFCRMLSNITGKKYTLPTEAQWEYAARGGKSVDNTKFPGSNMIDVVAWYGENYENGSTHSCGTKQPNELGLYDMAGNVWEWCSDRYNDSSSRVARGGSWNHSANSCRISARYDYLPHIRNNMLGFRVVCIP